MGKSQNASSEKCCAQVQPGMSQKEIPDTKADVQEVELSTAYHVLIYELCSRITVLKDSNRRISVKVLGLSRILRESAKQTQLKGDKN